MDTGLAEQEAPECQDEESHIYSHPKQRHITGVCPQVPPLLYHIHDCSPIHPTNTIVKFADDTTIVELIIDNNDTKRRSSI